MSLLRLWWTRQMESTLGCIVSAHRSCDGTAGHRGPPWSSLCACRCHWDPDCRHNRKARA